MHDASLRRDDGECAPLVSVLIPVYNEIRYIEEVLEHIRAQQLEGEPEFLFADGGSNDGTREHLEAAARNDSRLSVLDNPQRRIPQALNLALSHARGRYVARMDAHALFPERYLAEGIERLGRGDTAWVSGPALAVGRGTWSRRVARALETPLGVGQAAFRRVSEAEFDTDTGFAGVWRREVLEAVGGWDEAWPVNQDGELAGRMRAQGHRLVCLPSMAASYFPRDSLPAVARQYARYGMYRVKTAGRHPATLRPTHLLPPGLVATLAAACIPVPARRPARLGLVVYALVVAGVSARSASRDAREAAALPLVFAVMHVSWGAGFLVGCVRFGVPARALAQVGRTLLTRS